MMAATVQPNGKGLYVRGDPRDELKLAGETGCQFVAFNVRDPRHVQAARNLEAGPLGVWLYTLVGGWRPDSWRMTLARMEMLAGEIPVRGFIADVEDAPLWLANMAEHARMVKLLAGASRSVMVTSFPSHPLIRDWAEAGLGGSPQMYLLGEGGGTSPGTESAAKSLMHGWWDRWVEAGFSVLVPSLSIGTRAESAARTGAEQRLYLRTTPIAQGAIAWSQGLSMPAPGSELAEAWADYDPRSH